MEDQSSRKREESTSFLLGRLVSSSEQFGKKIDELVRSQGELKESVDGLLKREQRHEEQKISSEKRITEIQNEVEEIQSERAKEKILLSRLVGMTMGASGVISVVVSCVAFFIDRIIALFGGS